MNGMSAIIKETPDTPTLAPREDTARRLLCEPGRASWTLTLRVIWDLPLPEP